MKSMKSTAKLMNGEDVLKILSEQAPVGVCIMQDGKFCYVNSYFPIAVGYTVDELVGRDSLEIVVPEDREMVMENTIKMLKGEFLAPYQFRVTCKDGNTICVMATVKSIQYHGKRATLGNYMEVTGRRQLEEALEKSEERYKELANSITNVFFAMDDHLRYTYWNKASEILTGIQAEDAIGKSLHEVFPNVPWRRRAEKVYRNVLETQQPQTFVNDYDIGDRHYTFEISAYPSRDGISVLVKDVTERMRAEQTVRESEEKYRTLAEQSLMGLVIVQDFRIVYTNRAYAEMFGYSVDELLSLTPEQLQAMIHPEDQALVWERFVDRLRDRGVPSRYECRAIRKDGTVRWIEVHANRIEHDGKPAVQAAYIDITDYKRAEEALRQSEERYRTILDEMEEGYYEVDIAGNFTFVNDAMRRILGYSPDELIGLNYKIYTPKEDIKPIFQAFNRVYRTGEPLKWFPMPEIRKDGTRIVAEDSVFPLRNEKGEVIGFRGISRDITERMRAEETLRESEERYRALFDRSLDSVYVHDFEGNFLDANETALKLLGYEIEDIPHLNFALLLSEDQLPTALATLQELRDTGTQKQVNQYRLRCKDGSSVDVETRAALIYHDGKPYAIQGVGRDITERKQAEEALKRSEKVLESVLDSGPDAVYLSDLKGTFLYGNRKAEEIIGYSRDELVGKNFLHLGLLPEKQIEKAAELLECSNRGQPTGPDELELIRKDGTRVWTEVNTSLIQREEETLVIGFVRDITERKQAEQRLREAQEEKSTLLEEAPVAIIHTDLDGRIAYVNRRFELESGYSREELIGKVGLQLGWFSGDTTKYLVERMAARLRGSPAKHWETQFKCKDGRLIWIELEGKVIAKLGVPVGFQIISNNITERKEAEETLRRSEERYRTILDETGDGYFETDVRGNFTFVNDAQARLVGWSKEEIIGVNYRAFTPEENVKSIFQAYNHMYKTGEPLMDFPDEVIRKDGSQGFAQTSAFPIRNDKGEITGFRGVRHDMTEHKKVEDALRQSEEKYRTILEEMEDSYFEVDLGGHLTFANNSVCRDLGYSRKELIGMSYKDFTVKDDIESLFRAFNEVYRTCVPNKGFPWKTIRKDGSHGFAETSISILRNEKAEIVGFRGVGRDITERKMMEEALRQSEQNYRTLFDSGVIGTVLLDTETMKIEMANQAAVKMFGFGSEEEVLGLDPFAFVLPEDRERYIEIAMKAVFEKDSPDPFEIRALGKDGRQIWIKATATTITYKGKSTALISFANITEEKQQRDRLMMTDRLASLGEMASGAAHELNNPLTSILGFSQLLMDRKVPDDIREDLKLINSEAQRAASVTQNLLTFARKQAPMKQRNHINNIIDDVLRLRTYEHKANGIEVERHLAPNLPKIMVDYFQMQQVFMNIIINAEYFMIKAHNRGTLTVTTQKKNGTVLISIADDGPGIPAENLKRIFDPFFTTKEAGKGTGLGLSICHGIVTEHGGQIYAKSELGRGAAIFVELPISDRNYTGGIP